MQTYNTKKKKKKKSRTGFWSENVYKSCDQDIINVYTPQLKIAI